jgi:acetyl esterase/lipase
MMNLLRKLLPWFLLLIILILVLKCRSGMQKEPTEKAEGSGKGIMVEKYITYYRAPEKDLKLDIYWHGGTKEALPLIIWVHGGAWMEGNKESGKIIADEFLPRGYNVASISYRLSHDAIFPAQIIDCKAAVRWLRANADRYNIDPDRFGVWGSSAGGHLVSMLGTTSEVREWDAFGDYQGVSSEVQAVCDFYGPTDFLRMNDEPGSMDHDAPDSPESSLIGAPIQDNPELVSRANPITYINGNEPPFLIIHGDKDSLVIHSQSVYLEKALVENKIEVKLVILQGSGHGGQAFTEEFDRVEAFFNTHLK